MSLDQTIYGRSLTPALLIPANRCSDLDGVRERSSCWSCSRQWCRRSCFYAHYEATVHLTCVSWHDAYCSACQRTPFPGGKMRLKSSVRKIATSIGMAVCLLSGGLLSAAPAQANTWLPYEVNWFYSYETCASRGQSLVRSQPDVNNWLCQRGTQAGKWTLYLEFIDDFGCRFDPTATSTGTKAADSLAPAGC